MAQKEVFEIKQRTDKCLQLIKDWRCLECALLDDIHALLCSWRCDEDSRFLPDESTYLDLRLRKFPLLARYIEELLDDMYGLIQRILDKVFDLDICIYRISFMEPEMGDDEIKKELYCRRPEGGPYLVRTDCGETRQFRREKFWLSGERKEALDIQMLLSRTCQVVNQCGILSRASEIHGYRETLKVDDEVIDGIQQFAERCRILVENSWPAAPASTKARLVYGMVLRRQNLCYLRDRERTLVKVEKPETPPPAMATATATAMATGEPVSASMSYSQAMKPKLIQSIGETNSLTPPGFFTGLRLGRVVRDQTGQPRYQLNCMDKIGHLFPPAPDAANDAECLECPYCFQVCPAEELQGERWREHLMRDLMPYICLLDGCCMVDTLFEQHEDWIYHMVNRHATQVWICPEHPFLKKFRSKSRDGLETHIREQHPGEVQEAIMAKFVDECVRPDPRVEPLKECPLCLDALDTTQMSVNDILNHVSEHLISLALLCLPQADDAAERTSLS
ncbi:hypothetical protein VFPPC_12705 [Pochonia chlamydosporia 170]|uniref:4Fe-4S ferredoxin-type domain-containing protein n=1 Tax=Pochonia chlamydosporia 170 TaxID=1380566 RepID=A0A179G2X5_METCM|nr:hypothetical protein VFPPC_12705 [Pochonia chlamydosporia 170]OAQ72107.1 hypothetical protein VFPPC_12705 [Pochonia chlamydosporia 170]